MRHQSINRWQREAVLLVCLIKVGEVHAYPPFPVRLFNHHYVCQPIRVVDFSNVAGLYQFLYFFPLIACTVSGSNLHFFCLIDQAVRLTFSEWEIKKGEFLACRMSTMWIHQHCFSWGILRIPSPYLITGNQHLCTYLVSQRQSRALMFPQSVVALAYHFWDPNYKTIMAQWFLRLIKCLRLAPLHWLTKKNGCDIAWRSPDWL